MYPATGGVEVKGRSGAVVSERRSRGYPTRPLARRSFPCSQWVSSFEQTRTRPPRV